MVRKLDSDWLFCLSENGNKPRRKATTPGATPKSAVGGGRRVSAPPQFSNAGTVISSKRCAYHVCHSVIMLFSGGMNNLNRFW